MPERVVHGILTELRGKEIVFGQGIDIRDENRKLWTIHPDDRWDFNTLVESDGPYHKTPTERRKTKWRDGLLTQAGYRVIHVDAELTKNKAYQTYLKDRLSEAILSQEKVVRIDA